MTLDYVSRRPVRRYAVVGDRGTLTWDLSGSLVHSTHDGHRAIDLGTDGFDMAGTYRTMLAAFLDTVDNDGVDRLQSLSDGIASSPIRHRNPGAWEPSMTTICTICARGGSVGVPRKNVMPVGGKPLIGWSIEQALASPAIDEVYVSTDDDEIARIAEEFGASVPYRRPAELATSAAGKLPVIEHLVEHVESDGVNVDRIIDLDPTSPLRALEDIVGAAALLDEETDAVITAYPSDKNPYFNMVEQKSDGNIGLVKPTTVKSRQAAPTVYAMNGSVYVWHRRSLTKGLWDGRTRLYEMPRSRSIDIDSEIDLMLVELLLAERGAK